MHAKSQKYKAWFVPCTLFDINFFRFSPKRKRTLKEAITTLDAEIENSNPSNTCTSQDLELHSESSDDGLGCSGGEENVEDPFTAQNGAEHYIKEEKMISAKKIKTSV